MPVIHTATVYKCDICPSHATENPATGRPPLRWYDGHGTVRCPVHRADTDAHEDALYDWRFLRDAKRHDINVVALRELAEWERANPPPVAPWEEVE